MREKKVFLKKNVFIASSYLAPVSTDRINVTVTLGLSP
jgi:hypothetical protein